MGKLIAGCRRLMKTLQTAWSIAGITLLLMLSLETALRLTFALRDRLSEPESPDHRILAEGYGGATWPIDHYHEIELLEALAALRLLPAQALPRQDHHHRSRRPANDVAGGRSIQKRNREKDAEDTRLWRLVALGLRRGTTTQSPLCSRQAS